MNYTTKWIVLIDFSDYSDVLIKFTEKIAQLKKLEIIFIHQVYGMAPALTDIETKIEIIENEKLRALKKLKSITENDVFKNAKYIVSNKNLIELINEQTQKNGINIVVAGLKGTGILKQIFIGSTTTQIVNELPTITIAIPLHKSIFIPEKFIVATHYKFPLNVNAFKQLLSVFSTVKSVEFITIATNEDDSFKSENYIVNLCQLFLQNQVESKLYIGENALEEIKKHMVKNAQSFLIAQQGSRTLKDNIFRKFMINELVYHGKIPLIILPK